MNWVIKSVSLTVEHAEMVKKEGIKLSLVLRKALDDIHAVKTGELLDSNASLQAKVNRLMDTVQKMAEFMNKKGVYDDFLQT